MKASKGSEFEREVSKKLSLWWSKGLGETPRDDIFWRSSQSGGRATQRMKDGKTTYGSYGDIAAVDPIGEPLLKLFTIELKRGSTHSIPGDLLDFKSDNGAHPWVLCLRQAVRSHRQAESHGWMVIARRDFRVAMVYIDALIYDELVDMDRGMKEPSLADARFFLTSGEKGRNESYEFVALPLETFLSMCSPDQIIRCLERLNITKYESQK